MQRHRRRRGAPVRHRRAPIRRRGSTTEALDLGQPRFAIEARGWLDLPPGCTDAMDPLLGSLEPPPWGLDAMDPPLRSLDPPPRSLEPPSPTATPPPCATHRGFGGEKS